MPRIDPPMIRPKVKGDLIIGGPSGSPILLPIGPDGSHLTVSDGSPAWITPDPIYTRAEVDTLLQGYSGIEHTHFAGDVTGLPEEVHSLVTAMTPADIGAAPATHTHALSDVIITGTPDGTKFLRDDGVWTTVTAPVPTVSWGSVIGNIASQTDLIDQFALKSDVGHNHDGVYSPATHQHVVTDLSATGRTNTNYLRGDGTWASPPGTQYSVITSAEIAAGTSTASRIITPVRVQEIVVKAQTTVPAPTADAHAANKKYVDDGLLTKAAKDQTDAHMAAIEVHGVNGAVVGTDNTQTLTSKTLLSPVFTGNPTGLTKSHVGLSNVNNTSDADKPVSTAMANEIAKLLPRTGGKTIPFGDSITSGSKPSVPSPGGVGSYATWASYESGGVMDIIYNAGVGSDRTDQMVARIQADVISRAPDFCLIMGGVNDIAFGTSVSTIMTNIDTICKTCVENKIVPVLLSPIPHKTNAYRAALEQLWARVYRYARANKIPFFDMRAISINPTSDAPLGWNRANGTSDATLNSSLYFADGIHPTQLQAQVMGKALWAYLKPLYALSNEPVLVSGEISGASSVNLVATGMFTPDTNADGIADGWVSVAAGTNSTNTVASDPILGNYQTMTRSASGTAASIGQAITTGFSVGDVLEFACRFKTESMTGGHTVTLGIYQNGYVTPVAIALNGIDQNQTGIARVQFTVPAETTSLNILLAPSGTGSGIARIGQVTLLNTTTLGGL